MDEEGFNLLKDSHFEPGFQVSSLLINQGRNTKIYLLSNYDGTLFYYYQNGTLKNQNKIANRTTRIMRRHPHALFYNDKQIGFINSISLSIVTPKCEFPAERIISVYQENIYSQNIYIQIQSGDILVYVIKTGKHTECTINYKIPGIQQYDFLRVINGYIIGYKKYLDIYNSSLYKLYQDDLLHLKSLNDSIVKDYSFRVAKHNAHTSVTFEVLNHSQIRYSELQHFPMPQSSSFSMFESFRFPMILVAIFIVFIFQFWSKKQKVDLDDNDHITAAAKKKIDEMVREYQSHEKPE